MRHKCTRVFESQPATTKYNPRHTCKQNLQHACKSNLQHTYMQTISATSCKPHLQHAWESNLQNACKQYVHACKTHLQHACNQNLQHACTISTWLGQRQYSWRSSRCLDGPERGVTTALSWCSIRCTGGAHAHGCLHKQHIARWCNTKEGSLTDML